MEPAEYVFIVVLAVVNLAAGFGCAVPIATGLGQVAGRPERFFRYFAMLVGIYFVECVAFPMGMCTQVFSIGLAFVWGVMFGLWLRQLTPVHQILKQVFFVSVYTCLPTTSFGVFILLTFGGDGLSVEGGHKLGIPYYVPWPLNTIVGFCTALIIGTLVFKTVITTGAVSLLIHLGQKKGYIKNDH